MNFKLQDVNVNLNQTPIENMFLNMYVPMADGDALKVYLLVLKDIYSTGSVDSEKIKSILDFDDEKFNKAIEFWIGMGVFRQKKARNGQTYIEIVSFRESYFSDKSNISSNEKSFDKASRRAIMFENVENIIDRSLTPADITRIHETLDDYSQDPELVTEAFRQAKEAGNMDVKYVMGYLKTWRDQGVMSLDDLKIQEERKKLVRRSGPRTYKKNNKAITSPSNDEYSNYAEEARKARFRKMLGEDRDESK